MRPMAHLLVAVTGQPQAIKSGARSPLCPILGPEGKGQNGEQKGERVSGNRRAGVNDSEAK